MNPQFTDAILAPTYQTRNPALDMMMMRPPAPAPMNMQPNMPPPDLMPVQQMPQAPVAPPTQMPTAPQPLVDPMQMRAQLAAALNGQSEPSQDDRRMVLMQLAAALMQPPRPGQSVAGQFGQAVAGGAEGMAKAKKGAQADAMAKASLGMQVTKFDLELQKLQDEVANLPEERRMKTEKELALAAYYKSMGRASEASAALNEAKALHAADLAKAEIETERAQAGAAWALASSRSADAKATRDKADSETKGAKVKFSATKMNDGTLAIFALKEGEDKPSVGVVSQADALAIETQLKTEQATRKYTPEELSARRAELGQTKVKWYNKDGTPADGPAATPAPKPAAAPAPGAKPKRVTTDELRKTLSTEPTGRW